MRMTSIETSLVVRPGRHICLLFCFLSLININECRLIIIRNSTRFSCPGNAKIDKIQLKDKRLIRFSKIRVFSTRFEKCIPRRWREFFS